MQDSPRTTDMQLIEYARELSIPLAAVVSKDKLVYLTPQPYTGYIVNMQDSTAGFGTHWVAIWFTRGLACYFDSFGIDPPLAVQDFTRHHQLIVSRDEIQNINGGHCGQYCLVFLKFMSDNDHLPVRKRFQAFLARWH